MECKIIIKFYSYIKPRIKGGEIAFDKNRRIEEFDCKRLVLEQTGRRKNTCSDDTNRFKVAKSSKGSTNIPIARTLACSLFIPDFVKHLDL